MVVSCRLLLLKYWARRRRLSRPVNIVGGFLVTKKMLDLFKREGDPDEHPELYAIPVVGTLGAYGIAGMSGLGDLAPVVSLASGLCCIRGYCGLGRATHRETRQHAGPGRRDVRHGRHARRDASRSRHCSANSRAAGRRRRCGLCYRVEGRTDGTAPDRGGVPLLSWSRGRGHRRRRVRPPDGAWARCPSTP